MWAVDLRQSHEIPNTWIENASDLNSVLGKKKEERKNPHPSPVAETELCLENRNQQRTVGTEQIS